jgi:hypothetical protein
MALMRRRSGLLTAGGLLTLIAGVIGLVSGIYIVATGTAGTVPGISSVSGVELAVGIISIILGAVAIYGGINALRVKSWGWAMAGGVCGLLSSFIFGILGLIFIALRRRDF